MSKTKQVLALLKDGRTVKEITKIAKVKPSFVYTVRWQSKKTNGASKKKPSKIIEAVKQTKQALDVVQQPDSIVSLQKWFTELEAAEKKAALEKKPKRVMINLARRKDGAIIDLNKGGEVISPPDLVNKPPHYKTGGVETIDFIEAKDLNYRLGNVVKYVSRAGKKVGSDPVQDLEKAAFYLNREIAARKGA
jgi:hypothetical protein